MKVCLIGSHGTGKTSILIELKKYLSDYYLETISSTRRAIVDSNLLNFGTTDESQYQIACLRMEDISNSPNNKIFSRHMIDALAYSIYLNKLTGNVSSKTIESILTKVDEIINKKLIDLVIYVPIIFKLKEKNEFRKGQEDLQYQKDIDTIIKFLLWYHRIPYHTLTEETVEDRAIKICQLIKEKENHD